MRTSARLCRWDTGLSHWECGVLGHRCNETLLGITTKVASAPRPKRNGNLRVARSLLMFMTWAAHRSESCCLQLMIVTDYR